MPRRRAGTRAAHARLTEDERDTLLNGDSFVPLEDVFPTKAALAAAWFANREDLIAEWNAGAEKDAPRSAMPYGYWAAESPTEDPYRRAELRATGRALKRHRAAVAARKLHYKETPK
jgi:hypothetical protein